MQRQFVCQSRFTERFCSPGRVNSSLSIHQQRFLLSSVLRSAHEQPLELVLPAPILLLKFCELLGGFEALLLDPTVIAPVAI